MYIPVKINFKKIINHEKKLLGILLIGAFIISVGITLGHAENPVTEVLDADTDHEDAEDDIDDGDVDDDNDDDDDENTKIY